MPPPEAAVACGHPPNRLSGAQKTADHIGSKDALQTCGVHRIETHLTL